MKSTFCMLLASILCACDWPLSFSRHPPTLAADPIVIKHTYAPGPVDNPLKGLVPYQGDVRAYFPHSMEFNYISFGRLNVGPEQYDWAPLESLLDDVASRGHQAVFRIYLEYPKQLNILPQYLRDAGLKVHKYTNTQPLPPADIETPDYGDRNLRRALVKFIEAMGDRYDGDARIGYITAGLLGTWGEWHTYPREDLHPPKQTQIEVLDAYQRSFKKTPILLRYPAGENHYNYADNSRRPFGYHDDSFAWATLHTGQSDEDWFFMSLMRQARTLDKWKQHPIGGEIRPEAWGEVFSDQPKLAEIQNFAQCVEETHATWLMDSGLFKKNSPPELVERATQQVRRLGYEFTITEAMLQQSANKLSVSLRFENRGVAPFYHAGWQPEYALEFPDEQRGPMPAIVGEGDLRGLLPGDAPRSWTVELPLPADKRGQARVLLRIPSPLPAGQPLKFANASQDAHHLDWLTLGNITIN
jgi:hypothetical protein